MKFNSLEEEIEHFKSKKRFSEKYFSENLLNHLNAKYPNISLVEQFFLLINNMDSVPLCRYSDCNKKVDFISFKKGYKKGCSRSHSQKISFIEKYGVENPSQVEEFQEKKTKTFLAKYGVESPLQAEEIQKKIKKNNLEKYGVDYPFQAKKIQEKIKENNLKKYGVEYIGQVEEIQKKIKKTNLKKYGVENVSQSEIVKDKIKQTCLEKYGSEHYYQSSDFKEKAKKSSIKRYGTESPNQNEEIKKKQEEAMVSKYGFKCNFSAGNRYKIEKTMVEKYGSKNPMQVTKIKTTMFESNLEKYGCISPLGNKEVRKKCEKTNIEKYGVPYVSQSEEIKQKIKNTIREKYKRNNSGQLNLINFEKWNNKDFIKRNFFNEFNNFKYIEFMDYFNCCQSVAHKKIKDLGIEYNHISSKSLMENELFNYVEEASKIQSDRKILNGKELDIYIPDKKLAIEFNGVYWHSTERIEDKNYHLNKTKECEKQGIKLLHIFDKEWLKKREIVLAIINSNIGKYSKIFSCIQYEIKNLSFSEKSDFLNENHIFGDENSDINLGIFFEDELISVFTLKKAKQNDFYKISRFCNKIGYNVIDGIEQLWKYFVNQYKPFSVITCVDRRYNNETICKNLGFNLVNETKPNLITIDGYDIWDCGELIFEWTKGN